MSPGRFYAPILEQHCRHRRRGARLSRSRPILAISTVVALVDAVPQWEWIPLLESIMSISSRVSCAVIAVVLLPCWAQAQASLFDRPVGEGSNAVQHVAPNGSVDVGEESSEMAPAPDVATLPAPELATDPIPSATPDQTASPATETGPTASAATAGIQSRGATAHLTRQQLADRANQRDREDRPGIGRDAALMIVGGAAIVTGALIGGSAGTAFVVVGAVIGITGLVLILM
jgi:hypothetical protein